MILIRYNTKYQQGSSLLAVLLALFVLSTMILVVSRWLNVQQYDAALNYQRYQGLLLVQNQFARQRLGLACETDIYQNQLHFQLSCSAQQVKVQFPLGELSVSR